MLQDDQILYDELRQQGRGRRRKRKALRLHAPSRRQRHETQSADEAQKEETSRRGVRVLDMSDGYSVVE